jgi:hypothetical protein
MGGMRVRATGPWSFVIGPEFELIDNGDSVQAAVGQRVVYVSSKSVSSNGVPVGAAEIRASATRSFDSSAILVHVSETEEGDAQIRQEPNSLRLYGTMCSRGTIATCVIDFPDRQHEQWAISVWRSLVCGAAA